MNVVAGQVGDERGLSQAIPSMAGPRAPFVDIAAAMKRETGLAVFHATRITDLATAEHCVREGLVDMVAMTRAHMADPHIAAKMMRGEEERIRPCVGAGYCLDRIYVGGDALCLHNPATGRERTMPHVVEPGPGPRRKVVVVGAGPAGLEAARVSALRGHEVVVFEAARRAGRADRAGREGDVAQGPARHRAMARLRGRTPGRHDAPSTAMRRRRTCSRSGRTSWWSPPAGCRTWSGWRVRSTW